MGSSQADKVESHERIVQAAAARFRELGVQGIGVADLMKDAGLSHGGFYRHFSSPREELEAEAIEHALADGGQRVIDTVEADPLSPLSTLIDAYLSKAHCDGLATSCAVATLAGDVARSNERARTAYSKQVVAYLELLAKLIGGEEEQARRKAMMALSTLVGAVSMARAVNDESLARELLMSASEELKSYLA